MDFLQGDFRIDELVMKALLERVGDSKVQVVMDMAPNIGGTAVDIPAPYVSGGAGTLEILPRCAGAGGSFIVKVISRGAKVFKWYLRGDSLPVYEG